MPSPALVDTAFVAIVLSVVALVVLGFGRAARITGSVGSSRRASAATMGVFALIASLDTIAARTGWTTRWHELPPRIPGLALGALAIGTLAVRTRAARTLLPALSAASLVAFQAFRLPLELVLFALERQGRLPPQMTFEGRNFDVLVGASAPFVAWALSRGVIGWRTVLVWNIVSLGLLVNVTSIAVRSAPGPLFSFAMAPPLTLVAALPYTFLPGILVPIAYLGHLLSLRWVLKERAKEANAAETIASGGHDDVPA